MELDKNLVSVRESFITIIVFVLFVGKSRSLPEPPRLPWSGAKRSSETCRSFENLNGSESGW